MPVAATDRVGLYFKRKSAVGAVPGGNGAELRIRSESFSSPKELAESDEITADAQTQDIVEIYRRGTGSIDFALSYGAQDSFTEAAMRGAWAGTATVGPIATISALAADNSINDSGSGFASLTVGSWIRVDGFTTNGTTFVCKIVTKTTAKITVTGITLVDEVAGGSRTIKQADKLANGTTDYVFDIERKNSNVAGLFEIFRDFGVDGISLAIATRGFVTGTFALIGRTSEMAGATAMGTPTTAPANRVYNTKDHPYRFFEGGLGSSNIAKLLSLNFSTKLGLREIAEVGDGAPTDISSGKFTCEGSLTAYYRGADPWKTKFMAGTQTSLTLILKDAAKNTYVIEIPLVTLGDASTPTPGANQDVIVNVPWRASKDSVSGATLLFHRIAA